MFSCLKLVMNQCQNFPMLSVHICNQKQSPSFISTFLNHWSPGGSFMVHKTAVTSPIPVLLKVNSTSNICNISDLITNTSFLINIFTASL